MTVCINMAFPKRKICAGDMIHAVFIENRAIKPPTNASDYTMEFSPHESAPLPILAAIKTVKGEEVFDGHDVIGVTVITLESPTLRASLRKHGLGSKTVPG